MKNIHILPTDKPSRLYKSKITQDVFISDNMSQHGDATYNVNIYITSDEEIKEGDWVFNFEYDYIVQYDCKKHDDKFWYKKIILTTDPSLAPDVRKIDDEFLEWFVKNPNCEEVEVGYGWIRLTETDNEGYWVSIPDKQFEMQQEEPKQETVGKQFYESADKVITVNKQETLEESAENYARNEPDVTLKLISKYSFKDGAKWQQERMYSEEESIQKIIDYVDFQFNTNGELNTEIKKWFEQFKKK